MQSRVQKLTSLAISKMLQTDAENEDIIVQVFDLNPTKNGRIMCSISDGQFFTKAYLNDDSVIKPGKDEFSIVSIKSHGVMKNNVGVINLKFISKYPEKLGNPLQWATNKENAKDMKQVRQFRLEKLLKTESKKVDMPSAAKTTTGKDSDYQSIDDLHIGLQRWTILCRITSKTFKQSSKKGTKILEIQLVDKSKKKIIGTFFNEAAVDFNDYLKQGSIYQISKGRLAEGNYNNSKNDKLSCFTIIFDSKSQFNEVSDVNIIVKSEDSAITLGDLYQKKVLNQEFDVVAYVAEVKQQSSLQRDGKTVTVKEVIIADPESKITMSAKLWRWNQQFGSEMVGKVLIFSRFNLKQYKGSLSLYSGMRSSIIHNHGHSMKRYQNSKVDLQHFTAATETHERAEQDTSELCHSTRELDEKINNIKHGETIKSVLYVWINRFAFSKKWCYEACPKCKKAAQKYNKCSNCQYAIQDTNLNFMMGVEVSDFFGSIWITAYDQLAKKIFHDMGNTAARQLQQLSKDEMSEKLENYLYQPFKIKVMTKKDEQGRIRHNAGRLYQLQQERGARENMNRIKLLMGIQN